jgi:O-antigen ligase
MLVYVPVMTTLFVRRPDLQAYLPLTLVVSAMIQAVMIAAAVWGGLEWRTGTRIAGAMGSIALWLYVAAVVALIGTAMSGHWALRLSALVGLLAIAMAEMFLRSRMLWLSSVLGACLMLVLQSRVRVKGLLVATGLCAAVALPYLANWYPPAIQYRIDQTLTPGRTSDLVARVQVVQDLSGAIDESRGLGIGLGQSERYLRERHSTARVVNVHNVVMHAAVEGGLLAGASVLLLPLAIVALAVAAARNAGKDHRRRFLVNWSAASLLGIYIGSQLTPTLYEHSFFLLVAALGAAASSPARQVA